MTAVTFPELDIARLHVVVDRLDLPMVGRDLERLRDAIDHLELPEVDLSRLDLPHVELRHLDLPHVALPHVALPHLDLHMDLPHVELPHVDVPSLDLAALGASWRRSARVPPGGLVVGIVALMGGLAFGGLVAFLLHPTQGARRRKALRRRAGRLARRVLR